MTADVGTPNDRLSKRSAAMTAAGHWRDETLLDHLGRALDRLTQKRFAGTTLAMMRRPAAATGLADLQNFLERGYNAVRQMKGASEFLGKIKSRETELLETWFAG